VTEDGGVFMTRTLGSHKKWVLTVFKNESVAWNKLDSQSENKS